MNFARRMSLAVGLIVISLCNGAESGASECLRKEVGAHVRDQFSIHGPRSADHEYFGFVYLHDGIIGSAVVRSERCHGLKCIVDSAEALRSIPRSAKVLGEWHTHPHHGSAGLSRQDVRGAYNNRHINCYVAFYSTPDGEVYSWNPEHVSVPVAMGSRASLGNYNEVQLAVATRDPGVRVFSSVPVRFGRHALLSGTSMATPHVAGIAALWCQATGATGAALWARIEQAARPLGAAGVDVGSGLVQARNSWIRAGQSSIERVGAIGSSLSPLPGLRTPVAARVRRKEAECQRHEGRSGAARDGRDQRLVPDQ